MLDFIGVWLLHCHMEWHAETGLVATLIEAPLELQGQRKLQRIPMEQLKMCTTTGTELPTEMLEELGQPAEPEKQTEAEAVTDVEDAMEHREQETMYVNNDASH